VRGFTIEALQARALERGLRYPRRLLAQVVAALEAGSHIMLVGAPGTGKTSLAYLLADLGLDTVRCTGYLAVTASAEWAERHTIGHYADSPEGMVFQPGVFLDAIRTGRWLVIDELNRADFDQAFGPLFTVLTNQPVTLHYRRPGRSEPISIVPAGAPVPRGTDAVVVPRHWRIIATMNDVDRGMLRRLSYALMRRFAFIEVPTAPDNIVRSLVSGPGDLVADLLPVREFVDLGAAVFMDAAAFAVQRLADREVTRSRVLFEAFFGFILPQLDRLDLGQGQEVFSLLAPLFDPAERAELQRALRRTVEPGLRHGGRALHAVNA
jgi:MoxR-like ATPase